MVAIKLRMRDLHPFGKAAQRALLPVIDTASGHAFETPNLIPVSRNFAHRSVVAQASLPSVPRCGRRWKSANAYYLQ